MTFVRDRLRANRALITLLLAATLGLRALVPSGFMPMVENGRIVIGFCNGTGPAKATMAMPGMEHHDDRSDRAKGPCAFADLSLPALGSADPVQLAAALTFILASGLILALTLPIRATARLRPPLRGPPLPA